MLVGDLLNLSTGEFKKKNELENEYSFKITNFLDYLEVRKCVQKYIGQYDSPLKPLERPNIPNHLHLLLKQRTAVKNLYKTMTIENFDTKYRTKWNTDLKINIDSLTWNKIFGICFNTIYDNKIIWFQ